MLTKLFFLTAMLYSISAHAETKCELKEEPKPMPAPTAEKPDVHAPMDKHFLDRRPYMAPKKK